MTIEPRRLQVLADHPVLATRDEVQALARWVMQALEARARAGDPQTSYDAARSIGDMTAKRQAVLEVLRLGAATDDEIADTYRSMTLPPQSESGIRTRRGELVQLGLVRQVGTATKANGRRAVVWGIA